MDRGLESVSVGRQSVVETWVFGERAMALGNQLKLYGETGNVVAEACFEFKVAALNVHIS